MTTPDDDAILHEGGERNGTFFIQREGRRVAELTYRMADDTAVVDHTWVDPSLRGGRLAPNLVAAVVDWARKEKRKISPACSYVRMVMDRHPETYRDVRKS
jgi:predicted GNAT family acetyltransferase